MEHNIPFYPKFRSRRSKLPCVVRVFFWGRRVVRFPCKGFQYFDGRFFPGTKYHPPPRGNRGSGIAGIYTIIADQGYGRGVPTIFTPGPKPKKGMEKQKKV